MSDLTVIKLPLTKDEADALQKLAKKDCRLEYEQVRFVLRNYLIWAGALPKEPSAFQPSFLLKNAQLT